MSEQPSFWRRHRALAWVCVLAFVLLIVAAVAVSIILRNAEPILRAQIVSALEQHFHSRVELDSFHMSLRGGLRAEGRGSDAHRRLAGRRAAATVEQGRTRRLERHPGAVRVPATSAVFTQLFGGSP